MPFGTSIVIVHSLRERIKMNHLGTKTIETERLIIRQFKIDDAKDMFNNWANDSEVTKYLTWPAHKNVEVSKSYLESVINKYSDTKTYDWGIELKEIQQVIGSIGVVRLHEETGCVHIGYCIGKRWWNKGITAEAFSAVIQFLMDEVNVNRIESRHDPHNPASGEVMKKCGLKYEGTLRQSDRNNQGLCDASWYALLKNEYEQ